MNCYCWTQTIVIVNSKSVDIAATETLKSFLGVHGEKIGISHDLVQLRE